MSEFYTDVRQWGNHILYRGIKNGKHILARVPFGPTLYTRTNNPKVTSEWRSLYGEELVPFDFASIKEAREFLDKHDDIENFKIHGMTDYQYQYISKEFPNEISYDINQMRICFLDIEVISDDGFPDIQSASSPVVLIATHDKTSGKTVVYGTKSYNKNLDDTFEYRIFRDEVALLREFILEWQQKYPDIISGWNTDQFDFPYLINRITRILDEDWAKKLSPFGIIKSRTMEIRGREVQTYDIVGINQIDYLDAYKKFGTYSAKESYALGFIAQEELGVSKLEIEGSESFSDSYENFFDLFVKYNALDAQLVNKLDDKMKLLDLIVSVSYLVKCNFKDVFGPVKTWDVFIFNHLLKKKVAVPPRSSKSSGEFEGAWVKDVVPNMYGWTMSFDFASLYPTIIRQWNVSPETLVKDRYETMCANDVIVATGPLSQYANENDYTIAANGSMYRKDKKGILPELMEFLMVGRKQAKREMLTLQKKYEETHDASLLPSISALDNRQMALKILANAGYGAITNAGFRYFELMIGEAITLTGQASDRHVENSLNVYMNKLMKTESVDYVTYGDTDSLYLNVDPLVKKVCNNPDDVEKVTKFLDKVGTEIQKTAIQSSIDAVYDNCNCFDKLMDMKREAIASKAIWTAKKRYAMLVHNSEGVEYKPYKLKIMGLDVIKSSTPKKVRKALKEALVVLFDKGELALRNYVDNFREEFITTPVEEIAFPRSASDIDKWFDGKTYKSRTPIHVRGAIMYNLFTKQFAKYDSLRNGDKVKFVYLIMPNPIKEDVISFPTGSLLPVELGLHQYIDYNLMFEKTFMNPLQSITDAIKWKLIEESSLESFFI